MKTNDYRRKMRLKMDALMRESEAKKRDLREERAIEELQKELANTTAQLNRALMQVNVQMTLFCTGNGLPVRDEC